MLVDLVDTHTHVFFDDFNSDRDQVFSRASEAGVDRMINVGVDIESSRKAIELATRHEACFATVGCHPHEADHWTSGHGQELVRLAREKKVVAIGEIGLDFYKNFSNHENQKKSLQEMLKIAQGCHLPVVFHCRDAHEALIQILSDRALRPARAVLHCFTGTRDEARRYLDMGYHISFAGQITFRNAGPLREVAAMVPMDRLLLETDAPYLSPEPMRGKRNEPAHVRFTAIRQAELHGITLEECARMTSQNAKDLFGL
jgi:TatD DNase family protein